MILDLIPLYLSFLCFNPVPKQPGPIVFTDENVTTNSIRITWTPPASPSGEYLSYVATIYDAKFNTLEEIK